MDIKQIMTQARFWNNVDVIPQSNSSQCWEWTASKLPNGYGITSIGNGQTMLAHRYVASLSEDIDDKVVMHKCDNPGCVRPDHLTVGTQQDNMRDMADKGRNNTKLEVKDIIDIRKRQLSQKEYAKKYAVSVYTIGEVQRRKTWTWIP